MPGKPCIVAGLWELPPSLMLVSHEATMEQDRKPADIPLPKDWPEHARSAILHVIALAHVAIRGARGRVSKATETRDHLRGKLDNARAEIAMLKEELRIKDARMAHLEPRRRPHYRPTDRLAILELKAARAWSAAETARRLLVQPATIASWLKRVDEDGESALVQSPEPVNKFPAFVRHIVQRLKALNPTMGKKRISQAVARAGIHHGEADARGGEGVADGSGRAGSR